MNNTLHKQHNTMRALVAAWYEVGLAHLQYARGVDNETCAAHHESMAQQAFDKVEHYQRVMRDCLEK